MNNIQAYRKWMLHGLESSMKSFVIFIQELRNYKKTLVIILFSEIKVQVGGSDTLEAADKNKSINLS